VGAGELPDADQYGDVGSNTLANTAKAVGGLHLPNMGALGLGRVTSILGVPPDPSPTGCFGKMLEASPGKDTITGHWEIAGAVLDRPFPTFPFGFPQELISAIEHATGTSVIGNYAASGTEIIGRLGSQHVLTDSPIVYTSADSVLQIAMHEALYPIERQYEICRIVRSLCVGPYEVGRVICRPFTGDRGDFGLLNPPNLGEIYEFGPFRRTERRKDFPVTAPHTVLDDLISAGRCVHAIGKIWEIFNGRGISTHAHTTNNPAHIDALRDAAATSDSDLIFANLEDFDMLYGHRNDAVGMAKAIVEWDAALPSILGALRQGDLFIITADHGNDPTTPSTDHSREYPFLLAFGPGLNNGIDLGVRCTYADIAATIRDAFGLGVGANGISFLGGLLK
jgi:phosphopentomutase